MEENNFQVSANKFTTETGNLYVPGFLINKVFTNWNA